MNRYGREIEPIRLPNLRSTGCDLPSRRRVLFGLLPRCHAPEQLFTEAVQVSVFRNDDPDWYPSHNGQRLLLVGPADTPGAECPACNLHMTLQEAFTHSR